MEGMEVHVATDNRIIGRVSVDPEEGSKHKHMGQNEYQGNESGFLRNGIAV